MNYDEALYVLRRVRSLRPSDPVYRLASKVRHCMERRRFASGEAQRAEEQWETTVLNRFPGRGAEDPVEAAERVLLERLPDGWWHGDSFWEMFADLYPTESGELIGKGESVVAGRVRLFQWKEVTLPEPCSWSETYESSGEGRQWPTGHHSTIDFLHDPQRPGRDVKWCWELNRFQHLLWLGAAWRLTGDERFPRTARAHIESWMCRVRYKAGVQWASNLEVGLRLLSWVRCHILCHAGRAWDREFTARLLKWIYLHAAHLESELTVHHTQGNHLLGESAALWYTAVLYPFLPQSERRRRRGATILNRLVPRLILPDGVYAEQATGYFRFVVEFLLPVVHLARALGDGLQESIPRSVAAGLEFIRSLPPGAWDVPQIGDSDSGSAIGWQLSDYWDFTPLLAAGAVLLDRPSLAAGIAKFPAEAYLLSGQEGRKVFETMQGSRKESPCRCAVGKGLSEFPAGGRRITRDDRFGIVFDCGSLGMDPGFEHGHADGLSFILTYNGLPVVVDPGTGLYNGPAKWRSYFRSTLAHNTIAVDEKSQSVMIGTFRWSKPLKITREPAVAGEGRILLPGTVRWGRIVHRRYVLHLLDDGVFVLDEIRGPGTHRLDLSLNFSPACRLVPSDVHTMSIRCGTECLEMCVLDTAGSRPTILEGSDDPMGGWYSRLYGLIEPCPTVRVSAALDLPAYFVTGFKASGRSISLPGGLAEGLVPRGCLDLLNSSEFLAFLSDDDRK
ncbi:MAG: alginate lyase family protein [Pseudomonadota bacterium]